MTGTLTLGIGTQTNNTPATVTTMRADANGLFLTTFLSATNSDFAGSPSKVTSFSIDNAYTLFFVNNSGFNLVLPTLAFPSPSLLSGSFDWGLPFFFGRKVYVGIDGTSSMLGAGPHWAY